MAEVPQRPKLVNERRSGNTTRLADYYVQLLFHEGRIKVTDHHWGEFSDRDRDRMHEHLFKIIEWRLRMEHAPEAFIFDKKNRLITYKYFKPQTSEGDNP